MAHAMLLHMTGVSEFFATKFAFKWCFTSYGKILLQLRSLILNCKNTMHIKVMSHNGSSLE